MDLCYRNKKFLYEAKPDIFPEGYLTLTEQLMWGMFYKDLKAEMESRRNGN